MQSSVYECILFGSIITTTLYITDLTILPQETIEPSRGHKEHKIVNSLPQFTVCSLILFDLFERESLLFLHETQPMLSERHLKKVSEVVYARVTMVTLKKRLTVLLTFIIDQLQGLRQLHRYRLTCANRKECLLISYPQTMEESNSCIQIRNREFYSLPLSPAGLRR